MKNKETGAAPPERKNFLHRKPKSVYADQLICLTALTLMGVWRFEMRALIMCLISVGVCMAADLVFCRMSGKTYNYKDLSTPVCGLCMAMMMPASIDYGTAAFGGALAIGVKHIFGGKDNYIFNPACVATAFLVVCYPEKMLLYPQAGAQLELWGEVTAPLVSGMENYLMRVGSMQNISAFDILLGNFPGPTGTVNVLVMTVCGICMMCRRSVRLTVTVSGLSSFVIFSLLFPVYESIGEAVSAELICGYLLFGFIFLVSDPQTSPKTILGNILYGILIGALTVVFRHFGKTEASFVFALLMANALSVNIDRINEIIKKAVSAVRFSSGKFEKVKVTAAQRDSEIMYETEEIKLSEMSYNMPPIDNAIIDIKRRKPKLLLKIMDIPFMIKMKLSDLKKRTENPESVGDRNHNYKEKENNENTADNNVTEENQNDIKKLKIIEDDVEYKMKLTFDTFDAESPEENNNSKNIKAKKNWFNEKKRRE